MDDYDTVPEIKREPSTYEAMICVCTAVEDRAAAMTVSLPYNSSS
jgi:hypothetical protein